LINDLVQQLHRLLGQPLRTGIPEKIEADENLPIEAYFNCRDPLNYRLDEVDGVLRQLVALRPAFVAKRPPGEAKR